MNNPNQIDNIRRFLGFKIVGMSSEELISFLNKSSLKKDITKMCNEYTPFDPIEFDKIIATSAKNCLNTKKAKYSTEKERKTIIINALNSHRLSEVDRAFYQSSMKNCSVLSDAEANKNRNNASIANIEYPNNHEEFQQSQAQNLPSMETEPLCICEPFYAGKIMFQCDSCYNWFHPECLGISAEEIKAKEQQGEKELWFHSDDCKNSNVRNSLEYYKKKTN